MSRPYISVVCPVMRPGGLDVLFNSLERQTFRDFELVLCDSLYKYRKDMVKEKASSFSFPYKHITPIIDNFPVQCFSHAVNSAIVNASGEVIVFTTDYRHFMPTSLEKHAIFHRSNPDNYAYAPPSKFVLPPPMKQGLPSYGRNLDYEQYVKDLDNGKLQPYMWSIFENDLFDTYQDPSNWEEIDRIKVGYDPKTDVSPGVEASPLHIYLQSESVKTKLVLEANGLNEELDGAHSYQDIEFSHRLRNLFGLKWIGDNTNPTYRITGGHNIISKIKLTPMAEGSAAAIFEKYKNGSTDKVNTWGLIDKHREINGT